MPEVQSNQLPQRTSSRGMGRAQLSFSSDGGGIATTSASSTLGLWIASVCRLAGNSGGCGIGAVNG